MARNDVRVKRAFHHLEAFWQVELPEGFAKFQERISSPDVIDQDVELTVLLLDPGDEPLDGPAVGMVEDGGDAYPSVRRHPLRRFFNRLQSHRSASCRISSCPRTATRAVHRRAGFSQGYGDSSAGPPGRTCHKSDFFAHIRWSIGRGHGCLHKRLPNPELNCPRHNGPERTWQYRARENTCYTIS